MTDRERIARMITTALTEWQSQDDYTLSEEIADRILAELPKMGWAKLPFARIPQCACDPGTGEPPSRQKRLECVMRGGPCKNPSIQPEPA